jgi:hypothetical protein
MVKLYFHTRAKPTGNGICPPEGSVAFEGVMAHARAN